MSELSLAEARRIFLRNQLLTEPAADPLAALRSIVAVQTQYAANLPGALMARSKKYPTNWHDRALRNGRIVKSWTLRHTVHTHAADDHALVLAALGEQWREGFVHYARYNELSAEQLATVEADILNVLREGPLTRRELHAKVTRLAALQWAGWGADVKGLAFLGAITFANNDGATRFQIHQGLPDNRSKEEAGLELARRYFKAYGPATLRDFIYWSHMPMPQVRQVMTALEPELTPVSVQGLIGTRYLLGEVAHVPARAVRLLPKFDALALAHRDKGLFFDGRTSKLVFRPAGQIEALVLSRGEIVGTWRLRKEGTKGEIVVEPFMPLTNSARSGIEREAARMAKMLALKSIGVLVRPSL